MIKIFIVFLLLMLPFIGHCQSLGAQRVSHLKRCTVRVLVGGKPSGTGFVIRQDGVVLTCFHVVQSAFQPRANIEIAFSDGVKIVVEVTDAITNDIVGIREAVGNDFCVLVPKVKLSQSIDFLELGTFQDIDEGDRVVTVGYPLVVEQPVIAVGMLSTKWTQTSLFTLGGLKDSLQRNVAWLDLTMNRGNSGGAIVKIGDTIDEDKVIGIATFILNPYGPIADQLLGAVTNSQVDVSLGGISQNEVTKLFASAISNNSIGVNGCISIDHALKIIKWQH